MGRTPKPLVIVALPSCSDWEELAKLEKQGHTVIRAVKAEVGFNLIRTSDLIDADIVLGPNCWRMTNSHRSYLTLAIKESRMIKYDNHADRADTKKRERVEAEINGSSENTQIDKV